MSDDRSLVIDNGTTFIKAGFGGDDAPRRIFPTICGQIRKNDLKTINTSKSIAKYIYCGDEAQAKRAILDLKHPITRGIITNFDDMESIWKHTFKNELRAEPSNYNIMLTEPPLNPKRNREKMCQIMFETFNCNAFYLSTQSVLALFASGRTTGIVCDCGGGSISVVPIQDGYYLPHAVLKMDIAGDDLTKYLIELLDQKDININITYFEREIPRDIKEKLCYVSMRRKFPQEQEKDVIYELPDGKKINVQTEAWQMCEALFNPNLILEPSRHPKMSDLGFRKSLLDGYIRRYYDIKKCLHEDAFNLLCEYSAPIEKNKGIHELIFKSWMKCDIDIRNELYENIVLSGGSTMFQGMSDRLTFEIPKLLSYGARESMQIKVYAPPERKYLTWIGGSILCSLSTFEDMWITKDEYPGSGPSIVHRKCT
eukprot:295070_1